MELNISENHRQEVFNYLRFWRYQRGKRLRSVISCFDDIRGSRLRGETTFTIDEVQAILDELLSLVKGEMESELINTGHTNVLLLKQLFSQAEKWHLKLQTNISELENRDHLEQIREFEEVEFAGVKVDKDLNELIKSTKLLPMNETGSTALLHAKIEELERENQKLVSALRLVEQQAKGLSKEQENLKTSLSKQSVDASARAKDAEMTKHQDKLIWDMQEQIAKLLKDVESAKMDKDKQTKELNTDLTKTKHELLRVQDTLGMAEKELEKKVQETAPFKNMKQMLLKKNDQIKELRERLCKYEPDT